MTTGVTAATNAVLMTTLRNAIDSGPAPGYVRFYDGVQPAIGAAVTTQQMIALVPLADPCGTIDGSNGDLLFSPGQAGQIEVASMPTWGRVFSSFGDIVLDGAARSSAAADAGELFVVQAPSLSVGAFLIFIGGTLTLRNP